MCGIAGIVAARPDADLAASLRALRHRGPDGAGAERISLGGATAALGHTRLSIVELTEAGRQPMQSRDGRWWLTYNGEIYNHQELREAGASFRGRSDTESLLEAIAAQGVETTLKAIDGIYAFAALDTHEHALYLARDPFGVKPLYYAATGDGFAFASELRALVPLLGATLAIDPEGLQTFLALRYVPSPYTLYQGVSRLAPGEWIRYDVRSRAREARVFAAPTAQRFEGTFDDAVAAYHGVLGAEVRGQMMSDVPVGMLLSGGIDSALIAAVAREQGHVLSTYTVGMTGGAAESELDEAAHTARVLGLPHHRVEASPDELWRCFEQVAAAVEEPLGTTSTLLMWHLVKRAAQDVKVVLTGQGSDEPWGGYFRYQAEMVRPWAPQLAWRAAQHLPGLWRAMPESLERGLRSLAVPDPAQRFLEEYTLFGPGERAALTGRGGAAGALASIERWLAWDCAGGLPAAERMMRIDSRMNLADDLLLYGDKISMAFSLEARVPMLGKRVVSFVESLPLSYKLRLGRGKLVHKAMAARYLPPEIVNRKKKGFLLPFARWSRNEWRARIEERLLAPGARHLHYLDRDAIAAIWREHAAGRDRSRQVFALTMFAAACSGPLLLEGARRP
jgi:asparagine synthase (glutamine-hydrolysing)